MRNVQTRAYVARSLQQIETKLNNNVIFIPKDLGDAASDPPATQSCQQNKGYSELKSGEEPLTFSSPQC